MTLGVNTRRHRPLPSQASVQGFGETASAKRATSLPGVAVQLGSPSLVFGCDQAGKERAESPGSACGSGRAEKRDVPSAFPTGAWKMNLSGRRGRPRSRGCDQVLERPGGRRQDSGNRKPHPFPSYRFRKA